MRFLLDEMFPPAACGHLAEHGYDAVHVRDRGVDGRPDDEVAAVAGAEGRVLVTENGRDFARRPGLVVVCVLKARLPPSGMAVHLSTLLRDWAQRNEDPYVGLHWP